MGNEKRIEVFATNPFRVLYEGPLATAKAFYDANKEYFHRQNRTLGTRITNSYHFEWVFSYKAYGYTGVNLEGADPAFYFVEDMDAEKEMIQL